MPSRKLRLLITAGPTREYIDPVRYLSNESSGRMGFALAKVAARRKHAVTLVQGPVAIPTPPGVKTIAVTSAADMCNACLNAWPRQDALIMAAAVADYTPARVAKAKRKKSATDLMLRLKPTTDILATLAARRKAEQIVIGFALEDRSPRRNAASKLQHKNLDAIVLNRPEVLGSDRAAVEVLVRGEAWRAIPAAGKSSIATDLIRLLERIARDRST